MIFAGEQAWLWFQAIVHTCMEGAPSPSSGYGAHKPQCSSHMGQLCGALKHSSSCSLHREHIHFTSSHLECFLHIT